MKYYVVVVGITNGIPDMRIEETDSFDDIGELVTTYHKRGFSVAAFLGEQIQLNEAVTHCLIGGTVRPFTEIDKSQFTSDFVEGCLNE